mgnify:CR=1 FL=1
MINLNLLHEYLVDEINKLIKIQGNNGAILIVLAGFPDAVLHELPVERLFSFSIDLLHEYNNKIIKKELYSKIALQCTNNKVYWNSLLDTLLIDDTFLRNVFDVHYLKCPYYNNYIPLPFVAKDENVEYEYEDLSTEYTTPIVLSDDFCSYFDEVLGQMIKIGNKVYGVFSKPFDWKPFNYEFGSYERKHADYYVSFTLTEDEGSWATLVDKVLTLQENIGLDISVSTTLNNFNFENAIECLDAFCKNHIVIGKDVQSTKRNKYDFPHQILRHYWKKDEFRNFRVYKNVRTDDKIEILEENQLNVINDILTQVENAQSNISYRDIFVTAPTGTGKSVMFQIPAIHLHSTGFITLIISPLIALMNDQINSLVDKTLDFAATINSSISIVEKEQIITRIKVGEVSILYLSPESLLSRSDIKMLIGDRKIGLLVVDEAHIVTTWGKAFRPDYWYLGNYIQRLRKEQSFPIATFTATAIYKGPEDMYSETRDSLGMREPITYFGYVPREDISISFQRSNKVQETRNNEYNELKFSVVTERLEELISDKKKVLVYFPFVSLINDFCLYLSTRQTTIKPDDYSCYYGSMSSSEKKANFINFRSNNSRIMLATKAFGMGIDIPDIDVVYHFAPTGNVCDYIQEIGRAARDINIKGKAIFDYLQRDFSYVNKLHGISTLQTIQLIKVMRKILAIGEKNSYKRNLLVTSDAFQLIFDEGNKKDEKEFSNLDAKVKTALLIIEKDYNQKMGFSPIVARPRALFTYAWFRPSNDLEKNEIITCLAGYIKEIDGVLKIDLKSLWQDKYPNLSFAKFKYNLYSDQRCIGLKKENTLIPLVIVKYNKCKQVNSINDPKRLIDCILMFCHDKMQSGKYFKSEVLTEYLASELGIQDTTFLKILTDSILTFLSNWSRSIDSNNGRFFFFREDLGYRITNAGYSDIRDYSDRIKIGDEEKVLYLDQTGFNKSYITKLFSILGLLEIAQLINFDVSGGENPEIYIRVNSYFILRKVCFGSEKYDNRILENVWQRHNTSVKFLDYLFTTIDSNSDMFWNHIQNYFLGVLPDYNGISKEKIIKY